jgi:exopolysaccharide biosynthesis polyprenyl glycosylphosphotransferase
MNIFRSEKIKKLILLIGDTACFYAALLLMFQLRFGFNLYNQSVFDAHFKIFSWVFLFWLLIFYMGHFYEIGIVGRKWKFIKLLSELYFINFVLAIVFFYIFPSITPKTNLLLVALFSFIFLILWRFIFNSILGKTSATRVLILGNSKEVEELKNHLDNFPQLGYKVAHIMDSFEGINKDTFINLAKNEKINIIVVDRLFNQGEDLEARKALFRALFAKVSLLDLAVFYEMAIKKIPLSVIDELWFFSNFNLKRRMYEAGKRFFDFIFSLICLIITLPFWPFIILGIRLDSSGPAILKMERVGENNKNFKIWKFRTMINQADKIGPHWTVKNDSRITKFGIFLRHTHIDEIPQFINILKGDMSFVGPRPEEKALVELYSDTIPFYRIRHMVKPGIIGWAILNYSHGASVEDAVQKLQYDLYYIKNRTFWLDLGMIIKIFRILLLHKTH